MCVHCFSVYQMCPLHELMCPRGLQEDDFVDLLRSTFPQLTADEPFDLFVSDKSRKLKPLKVRSLTTEEVERATRTSTLYIRLKVLIHKDLCLLLKKNLSRQRNNLVYCLSLCFLRILSIK